MPTPPIKPTAITALLLLLCGCHSVYFYETDKISLTVEVRPDSTGPVQGNFGLKQRVVAFVPPRTDAQRGLDVGAYNTWSSAALAQSAQTDAAVRSEITVRGDLFGKTTDSAAPPPTTHPTEIAWTGLNPTQRLRSALAKAADPAGDAMSVLSSMRFHKWPKPEGAPWYRVSHMTIDAALITGAAAKVVAQPGQAIGALSGQTAPLDGAGLTALVNIYEALRARAPTDAQAKRLADDLDALATSLPATYPFNFYQPGRGNDVLVDTPRGAATARQDFRDVTAYWATLEENVRYLQKVLAASAPFTVQGAPAGDLVRAGLTKELEDSTRLRDQFRASVGAAPVIRQAVAYFQKMF